MEYSKFCVNCGQKLTSDVKFCPKCGVKVYEPNEEKDVDENQDEKLYSQYQEKVENAVVESYLSDIKLNRNNLYTQGEKYNYSKEKIDDIIIDYEKKINEYLMYLTKMYQQETLLLLEVTDEIKNECSGYAEFIGLYYVEGEKIFDKFIRDNMIREKSGILTALLIYYHDTGEFKQVKSKEGATEMEAFNKKEYICLKEAVEQLLNLQEELHKKSNSIYLSKEEKNKIKEKAFALGFQKDDEYVDAVIHGNEIKLGYSLKQEIEKRNKLREENKNRLSKIVPSKTVTLMEEKYEFGSCYFVEKEIKKIYKKELSDLKKKTVDMMRKYDVSKANCSKKFVMDILENVLQWENSIENFNNKFGISQDVYDEVKDYYREAFMAFAYDLEEIQNVFLEIEQGVEETVLKGKMNKALRGKWVVAGVGVSGMINGAITQSVLNAGTGLAYDAINGVSESVAKHNSQRAKERLRDSIIPSIAKFFDMLIDTTSEVYMEVLCKKYPFIIWHSDEEFETKLLERYKLSNEQEKISIIKDLIFENPYNPRNYLLAFYRIQEKDKPEKDVATLKEIAGWFNIKPKVTKEIFTDVFNGIGEVSKNTCDELLSLEKLLKVKYTPIQSRIYQKYLENEISKILVSYTPEEINKALKLLKDFNENYEYSTSFLEDNIQNEARLYYRIESNPRTIEDYEHTIKQLKYLEETCPWDFEKEINKLEKRLKSLLQRRNIETRTVEAIQKYDITSKKFKKIKMLAQSAEIKDKMVIATPQIEEQCLKLSFDMEKEQFDSIIQAIMSLCTESQYDNTFVNDLQEQWNEVDRCARTVQGIEYKTKEEAVYAQVELEQIKDLYKEQKSKTQKYHYLKKCSFETEQAKQIVNEKERELIEHIAYLEQNKNFNPTINEIKDLGLTKLIVKIVAMLVLNLIFNSGLLKAICVIAVVVMLTNYSDERSDIKKKIEEEKKREELAESCKKELEEFNSIFEILDNHIILKSNE